MPDDNKGHVFISHSGADREFVRLLAAQLKARYIPVWMDEEELQPGSSWPAAIASAMRDASVIVVVFSENSANSNWQNVEMGMAWSLAAQSPPHAQRVIPIRLTRGQRTPELPAFLRTLQFLDSDTTNVVELAESVADAIKS